MKKRLLIVLGLGFVTLLVATILYYYRPGALYSRGSSSGTQTGTLMWTPQELPPWTLVRGQELIYDLNYTGSGLMPGQNGSSFEVQLRGSLHILVLSEETDGYRVWLSIKPEGQPQWTAIPSALRSSLFTSWTEGLGARLQLRGFALEPQMPTSMDPLMAQFWASLCERMQVSLPRVLPTPIWKQQENMAGAVVEARYEIDPTHISPALISEKIYIQKSFDATPAPQKKLSGESLILMRPRFEGLEQLQVSAQEVQVLNGQSWSTDTALQLQWRMQGNQNEARLASLEARWGQSPGEVVSSQEASIQKAALGSLGLDDLWEQLHQPGTQSSQELYLKLKAWIYLHPAEIKRLMDRLKTLDESDPALKMAIRALAAAGQPEAQNALVDLLDQRPSDVPLARKIITTLGLVPEPTTKAQETLERLSQADEDSALRRSSRLALGMMGQRLSQDPDANSQKRALDLEALALKNLKQAQGLAATQEALAVIGNCGLSRIEDLEPWLNHQDPAIRGQAYFALRFARPAKVPDYLVEQYPQEPSAEVKRQIVQALSLRTPDERWFLALTRLLKQALPDSEKLTLAKSLVGTVRKHQDASLKILELLQEKTQDAGVRESLAAYQDAARKRVAL